MRILLAPFILVFIFSCGSPLKKSGGPVKTEKRNITTFSAVEARDAVEIDFMSGTAASLTVDAPADLISKVLTEVKDGTLYISVDEKIYGTRDPIRIHIQSPELNKVKMSGACSFDLRSPLNNAAFNLDLSGASSFSGTLYNSQTEIEMTGASVAEIGGITNQLTAHTSGASSLDAEKFSAVHVKIESSGASNSSLFADSSLQAKASGASSISYSGHPSKTEQHTSSGAIIEEK